MSVTIRHYRNKARGWELDIRVRLPDGTIIRERRKAPVKSKSAALRWAEARERVLMLNGKPECQSAPEKEVPTLQEFAPRFLDGYVRANRLKPSGVAAKELILRVHLAPQLGTKKLSEITTEAVQRLKGLLQNRAPKTVNNVLTVLNVLLKTAVDWGVITEVPCSIRLLKVPKTSAAFHEFDVYERLVEAARLTDLQAYLVVLLGGEAGLRCGEMIALEWADVDLANRQMCVRHSDWNGQVTAPKGGKFRFIPLTVRLTKALRDHRHLRSPRVLCRADGRPLSRQVVQYYVKRSARRANVSNVGVHVLRHTFCSHLSMRGAPVRAIQELAGHRDLSMTQRYMHVSPAAIESAIGLLDRAQSVRGHGEIVETAEGTK